VAAVEADGVSRKQPSHERGKGDKPGSKEEMGVIGKEHPCVTGGLGLGQKFRRTRQEILPIPVVYEDLSTLNTPDHDVVQDTGRVQAGLSRRCSRLHRFSTPVNLLFYQRYILEYQ